MDAISLFIGWMMAYAIPDQRPDRDEITFVATHGKHSVKPVVAVTNIIAG